MVPDRQSPDEVHAAARDYVARGWSVIPVEPRGKRPRVPWTAFQHRLPSQAEVDEWFRRWPDANVGIVTGAVSGLVVIDVDPRHGGEGSLQDLERGDAPLPRTVEAATGGGGRHLYFAHPGGTVANRVGLAPGIDLRGDGGCVVAPPSMHASGRRYAWVDARAPGESPLAPPPPWIRKVTRRGRHTQQHWRDLVRDGVAEGQRNASLASLAGSLLRHGLDPDVALELLLAWNRQRCRPPLPDDEVARVVASIARLHSSASLS
jgi:Bifunctional DNA primase/polymerase, N-terminal/Primase C terminal 1 (PriCT-1)